MRTSKGESWENETKIDFGDCSLGVKCDRIRGKIDRIWVSKVGYTRDCKERSREFVRENGRGRGGWKGV